MSCPMLRPPRRQYLEVLPFIVEPYRPNFQNNPSDSSFSISSRGSIQKRTHRGAAEGAEQRVLDQEIFRSLRGTDDKGFHRGMCLMQSTRQEPVLLSV